jgi:hypothetical protein
MDGRTDTEISFHHHMHIGSGIQLYNTYREINLTSRFSLSCLVPSLRLNGVVLRQKIFSVLLYRNGPFILMLSDSEVCKQN